LAWTLNPHPSEVIRTSKKYFLGLAAGKIGEQTVNPDVLAWAVEDIVRLAF